MGEAPLRQRQAIPRDAIQRGKRNPITRCFR
jgi:hypothetical protein